MTNSSLIAVTYLVSIILFAASVLLVKGLFNFSNSQRR